MFKKLWFKHLIELSTCSLLVDNIGVKYGKRKKNFAELLSNVQAVIHEVPDSDGYGVLKSVVKDPEWFCLFKLNDCVLCGEEKDMKVGAKVFVNANLIDPKLGVQYIASCVWKLSETSWVLPNIVDKKLISSDKINKYYNHNTTLEKTPLMDHLEKKEGFIAKILDENFGIINVDGNFVLFDTCDFWMSTNSTAAQSNLKLLELVKADQSSKVKLLRVIE